MGKQAPSITPRCPSHRCFLFVKLCYSVAVLHFDLRCLLTSGRIKASAFLSWQNAREQGLIDIALGGSHTVEVVQRLL